METEKKKPKRKYLAYELSLDKLLTVLKHMLWKPTFVYISFYFFDNSSNTLIYHFGDDK